jgi:hypothetical protein
VHVKTRGPLVRRRKRNEDGEFRPVDRLTSIVCVPKRSGKPSAEAQDLIREHP